MWILSKSSMNKTKNGWNQNMNFNFCLPKVPSVLEDLRFQEQPFRQTPSTTFLEGRIILTRSQSSQGILRCDRGLKKIRDSFKDKRDEEKQKDCTRSVEAIKKASPTCNPMNCFETSIKAKTSYSTFDMKSKIQNFAGRQLTAFRGEQWAMKQRTSHLWLSCIFMKACQSDITFSKSFN